MTPYASAVKAITAHLLIFFITLNPGAAFGNIDSPMGTEGQIIETKFSVIHYQDPEDLLTLNKKLKYPVPSVDSGGIKNPHQILKTKIDAIFTRAQDLLGMRRPGGLVHIRVFQDKRQLDDAFYQLFKQECQVRSWYVHKKKSIYIQLNDLHAGMLSHEFAHAIIDTYLIVPPPSESAEILARYVDAHLVPDESLLAQKGKVPKR